MQRPLYDQDREVLSQVLQDPEVKTFAQLLDKINELARSRPPWAKKEPTTLLELLDVVQPGTRPFFDFLNRDDLHSVRQIGRPYKEYVLTYLDYMRTRKKQRLYPPLAPFQGKITANFILQKPEGIRASIDDLYFTPLLAVRDDDCMFAWTDEGLFLVYNQYYGSDYKNLDGTPRSAQAIVRDGLFRKLKKISFPILDELETGFSRQLLRSMVIGEKGKVYIATEDSIWVLQTSTSYTKPGEARNVKIQATISVDSMIQIAGTHKGVQDGPPTSASFFSIRNIHYTSKGNIFVLDNYRGFDNDEELFRTAWRKIDIAGITSTIKTFDVDTHFLQYSERLFAVDDNENIYFNYTDETFDDDIHLHIQKHPDFPGRLESIKVPYFDATLMVCVGTELVYTQRHNQVLDLYKLSANFETGEVTKTFITTIARSDTEEFWTLTKGLNGAVYLGNKVLSMDEETPSISKME